MRIRGVFGKRGQQQLVQERDVLLRAIRDERLRQGLTQTDLAQLCGTGDRRAISDLECGRSSPNLLSILRVSSVLGMEWKLVPTREVPAGQQSHPDDPVS